jgi:hypothetical protein
MLLMQVDKTQGQSVSGGTLVRLEDFRDVHTEGLGDALDHQDRWSADLRCSLGRN